MILASSARTSAGATASITKMVLKITILLHERALLALEPRRVIAPMRNGSIEVASAVSKIGHVIKMMQYSVEPSSA